jgi:signal transduction histidine kinase/HAMP domain-containing protein
MRDSSDYKILLTPLHQRWQSLSLGYKLLLPIIALMLISLLVSTLTFVVGTERTRDQLLAQQVADDSERASGALASRAETVAVAARLLAHDPNIVEALQAPSDSSLMTLNSRALVMRERFGLSLIQIYNRDGEARTNLVLSSLYRQSSLLEQVNGDAPVVRVVDQRLLLLSRADLPDDLGAVITGYDLETELRRIASEERLLAELGLQMGNTRASTGSDLPFDAPNGYRDNQYIRHMPLALGQAQLDLVIARQTSEITHVTQAGLVVMVASTLATTLLLLGAGVLVTRSIVQPVHRLAAAARTLAVGDLSHVEVKVLEREQRSESQDEIDLLAHAFNHMVGELRELYGNLEAKVEARTRALNAAAHVARAASCTLDLDELLRASLDLICRQFGSYHASVFVVDEHANVAVLRESSSEAGRMLKVKGYQLAVGSKSLVGAATATRQPCIVQDVLGDPTYLQNTLLPYTRAEAVFPMLIGKKLIGALDVQSTQVNAFSPDVAELLKTLANQIAVAVRNAQLYEKQKEIAKHLAEVDRLKTQFLANMSHELRTPLNSIIGFSRVILKGIDGPINETQTQDLENIYNSGQHLLGLVNDILDISKINAGQVELSFAPVDCGALIESVMATAHALIKDKPILLDAKITQDLPKIMGDSTRIRQVLLNLLSNAAKFTEEGHIVVRAQPVEAIHPRSGRIEPFVQVSVSDTGIGIAPEDMRKLFEPFSQVDDSLTRKTGGSGLGLSISRHLVELHGGRIWAESRPGVGSTFTFTLPVGQSSTRGTRIELDKKEYGYVA